VAGVLVGATSVGCGSIIMTLLLLFYRYHPKVMLVPTLRRGPSYPSNQPATLACWHLNPTLVASLLIGSIPGGVMGSHLSTRVPVLWLRRILCDVLLATRIRMLWA
jgi:uncharacterized membrane protein YfcA